MPRMAGHRFGRPYRLLSALVLAAGVLALGAAGASADPAMPTGDAVSTGDTAITAFSAPGDYVGAGVSSEFDATNASITGTAASFGIDLSVTSDAGGSWTFILDPPRGTTFHEGYYPGTQRAYFRTGGHPGLDISGNGNGCDGDPGSIDVRDLAVSGTKILRLDLVYVQYCGIYDAPDELLSGSPGALFGEIRIGEPEPSGLLVTSGSITWSPTWIGDQMTVPIYIRNRGRNRVPISAASLTGWAAGEFRVSGNSCAGKTLAPRASCLLALTYTRAAPGPRTAALQFKIGKAADRIQLDAPEPAGTTSLTMASQPGDWVGQGHQYNFNSSNAGFGFQASPAALQVGVADFHDEGWTAMLGPAAGHTLAPGTYPITSATGPGNYLSVFGEQRGCSNVTGEFTIKQVVFSGSVLEHFDATFTQQCAGDTGDLTGEIKFDSAPVVTLPSRVSGLSATRSGGQIKLAWKNPPRSHYRYTVVRVEPGRAASDGPSAGVSTYEGAAQQTTIGGLSDKRQYTIAVFTVDQYGNVSAPSQVIVTG